MAKAKKVTQLSGFAAQLVNAGKAYCSLIKQGHRIESIHIVETKVQIELKWHPRCEQLKGCMYAQMGTPSGRTGLFYTDVLGAHVKWAKPLEA